MPVHRYGNSWWYSEAETQAIADAAELIGYKKAKEQAAKVCVDYAKEGRSGPIIRMAANELEVRIRSMKEDT